MVKRPFLPSQREVKATFHVAGQFDQTRTYSWSDSYFHPVNFEVDSVQGTAAVTEYDTPSHPNQPAGLRQENLTIDTVYRRTGFRVPRSPHAIQLALRHDDHDIVSAPLQIRVAPPADATEEDFAQDLFTEEVGRTLDIGGTRELDAANDALGRVVEQFGNRRIATHARLALGQPLAGRYKLLTVKDSDRRFVLKQAESSTARRLIDAALLAEPDQAADTLGHIADTRSVDDHARHLADEGDSAAAAQCVTDARAMLAGRGVIDTVLSNLSAQADAYSAEG
ncbi:MAG: hypothetical protein ACI91O_001099 [Candidatus Poriferisodalaceae bacterium]